MTEIGGYFGFETWHDRGHYHSDALAINSGRHALELILADKDIKVLYLPKYYCDVLLEPISRLGVHVEYYDVTMQLEVPTEIIGRGWLLYINYFGLKDNEVIRLAGLTDKLIVDNSQAFYSKPLKGVPTFYSCRKFFGVPDGGYVYGLSSKPTLELDDSKDRFTHLLGRTTDGAQMHFATYKEHERIFSRIPPRLMSVLTNMIMSSIDYKSALERRLDNFNLLHEKLGTMNELKIENGGSAMCYPYKGEKSAKAELLKERIYIANYWPNVTEQFDSTTNAYKFAKGLDCLPVDHRYTKRDMERVAEIVKKVVVS